MWAFLITGGPSSFHERGRDSCLRAVLCYKRLFTKVCMGCKRFFLKEIKNVMFLNKIDVTYCLVVFFVVCPRLRPFWSVFGELALFWCPTAKRKTFFPTPLASKSHVRVHEMSLGRLCLHLLSAETNLTLSAPPPNRLFVISQILGDTWPDQTRISRRVGERT